MELRGGGEGGRVREREAEREGGRDGEREGRRVAVVVVGAVRGVSGAGRLPTPHRRPVPAPSVHSTHGHNNISQAPHAIHERPQ